MNNKVLSSLLTITFSANTAWGAMTIDYSKFNRLLHKHVKDGKIDYESLREEESVLHAFLSELQTVDAEAVSSKEARIAFWINAYNAFVLKAVLDHLPIRSVRDVEGFFDKIPHSVGGQSLTLNQIEAKARALKDPRVHFAFVCASLSCPLLRPEAYVPHRLNTQLASQSRQFLADPQRGLRFDETTGRVSLSQIFKWYAADFLSGGRLKKPGGSEALLTALEPYMDDDTRRLAQSRQWKIRFLPYDWSLNNLEK